MRCFGLREGLRIMAKDNDAGTDRFRKREERKREYEKHLPGVDDEPLPPAVEPIHTDAKPKRNDPCPCGSGKKYKKCCGR